MQIMKQLPNGDRVNVSEDKYKSEMFIHGVDHIIRTDTFIVYRAKAGTIPAYMVAAPRLRYGGVSMTQGR